MWRILITCNIDLKHDYITIQVKINNFTVDCLKSIYNWTIQVRWHNRWKESIGILLKIHNIKLAIYSLKTLEEQLEQKIPNEVAWADAWRPGPLPTDPNLIQVFVTIPWSTNFSFFKILTDSEIFYNFYCI
jgi:hypothetical protein